MARGSHYSTAARHEAQQILSQPPFRVSSRTPAPLAGVLHAIGRGLNDIFGKPIVWLWDHTAGSLHGVLGGWAWVLLGMIALSLGGLAGGLLLRRRGAVTRAIELAPADAAMPGAQALEQAAEDAEARGAHDLAVRLRFQAGLARLEARGIIGSRLTTTTDRLRTRLGSPTFDRLAERHEAIAYANDPASKDDYESAGAGWSRVLEESAALPSSAVSPPSAGPPSSTAPLSSAGRRASPGGRR